MHRGLGNMDHASWIMEATLIEIGVYADKPGNSIKEVANKISSIHDDRVCKMADACARTFLTVRGYLHLLLLLKQQEQQQQQQLFYVGKKI